MRTYSVSNYKFRLPFTSLPPRDYEKRAIRAALDQVTLAERAPVELALAGHTHGGQVVLPLIGPLITKTRLPRSY